MYVSCVRCVNRKVLNAFGAAWTVIANVKTRLFVDRNNESLDWDTDVNVAWVDEGYVIYPS